MPPLVTVLMPVYNAGRALSDAVNSILGQSFRDFELLIIDDGSTDGSADVIKNLSDSRIRLLQNDKRLKLSGALNRGFSEARGEFIARMDADDISRPKRFEMQVSYMREHPAVGIVGAWVRRFGAGTHRVEKYPVGPKRIQAYTLFYTPFAHPTVMFRRAWFDKHTLRYDGSYNPTEDFDLWERALHHFPGDNLPKVLLDYRMHTSSMTGAGWTEMDYQAGRVLARPLERLGVRSDSETVQFHRQVARVQIERTPHALEKAESWLKALGQANQKNQIFDHLAFRDVIHGVWLKQCVRCAEAGLWAVRRYAQSPLTTGTRTRGTVRCLFSLFKPNPKRVRGDLTTNGHPPPRFAATALSPRRVKTRHAKNHEKTERER